MATECSEYDRHSDKDIETSGEIVDVRQNRGFSVVYDFRLLQGDNVDLLMLARNAGTSVDQLERFYLSHADPAMKVANLHSMKPQPQIEYVDEPEWPRSAIQLEAALE